MAEQRHSKTAWPDWSLSTGKKPTVGEQRAFQNQLVAEVEQLVIGRKSRPLIELADIRGRRDPKKYGPAAIVTVKENWRPLSVQIGAEIKKHGYAVSIPNRQLSYVLVVTKAGS